MSRCKDARACIRTSAVAARTAANGQFRSVARTDSSTSGAATLAEICRAQELRIFCQRLRCVYPRPTRNADVMSSHSLTICTSKFACLIDVAETLLGQFDQMEQFVTKAQWPSRAMPPPKKSREHGSRAVCSSDDVLPRAIGRVFVVRLDEAERPPSY